MTELVFAKDKSVIPIVISTDLKSDVRKIESIRDAGYSSVEVVLRTPTALQLISIAKQIDGLSVGAGTVLNPRDLQAAYDAGADFTVAPGLEEETIRHSLESRIQHFPGVATPTDVMRCLDLGVNFMKVFPISSLGGVSFLKALESPLKSAKFMPSGGVSQSNFAEYLSLSNVFAVSGSWMVNENAVELNPGL